MADRAVARLAVAERDEETPALNDEAEFTTHVHEAVALFVGPVHDTERAMIDALVTVFVRESFHGLEHPHTGGAISGGPDQTLESAGT